MYLIWGRNELFISGRNHVRHLRPTKFTPLLTCQVEPLYNNNKISFSNIGKIWKMEEWVKNESS